LPPPQGLVFPFVKMMGADEKATFEVMATVLLNWAQGWLEAFPTPPLRTLRAVEVLLEAHDPNLAAALGTMAGTAGAAGASWLLLQVRYACACVRKPSFCAAATYKSGSFHSDFGSPST
jgi:hypothetical protein